MKFALLHLKTLIRVIQCGISLAAQGSEKSYHLQYDDGRCSEKAESCHIVSMLCPKLMVFELTI